MDISIIIVNYNVKYFLEQCLYSVAKACRNLQAEIFVVDNASSDGSQAYFSNRFPEVNFIWQDTNTGFAKANNSQLSRAKGDYVLFLNPDTIIAEDTLEICLDYARKQKNFGALGVSMIDGSGNFLPESKRMFPSTSASFYKMLGITKLFPSSRFFSKYYASHLNQYESGEVEVLAGAFMLVSKQAIDLTRGFDEDFFMYGEDIDLSYRITKAGLKNFYCGESSIIHFKGESIQSEGKSYLKNFYGAMLLFVKKHGKKNNTSVKAGILAAYALASFKQRAKLTWKSDAVANNAVCIVAGEQAFNKILQLLKLSVIPFLIKGRIAIDPKDTQHRTGDVKDLKSLVKKNRITHLVLAEGDMNFKKMIDVLQQHKNLAHFLIHARDSKSIVGSSDKNQSGFYIADTN